MSVLWIEIDWIDKWEKIFSISFDGFYRKINFYFLFICFYFWISGEQDIEILIDHVNRSGL